jgi:hypothetical protein
MLLIALFLLVMAMSCAGAAYTAGWWSKTKKPSPSGRDTPELREAREWAAAVALIAFAAPYVVLFTFIGPSPFSGLDFGALVGAPVVGAATFVVHLVAGWRHGWKNSGRKKWASLWVARQSTSELTLVNQLDTNYTAAPTTPGTSTAPETARADWLLRCTVKLTRVYALMFALLAAGAGHPIVAVAAIAIERTLDAVPRLPLRRPSRSGKAVIEIAGLVTAWLLLTLVLSAMYPRVPPKVAPFILGHGEMFVGIAFAGLLFFINYSLEKMKGGLNRLRSVATSLSFFSVSIALMLVPNTSHHLRELGAVAVACACICMLSDLAGLLVVADGSPS